jgi:arylsulfatase
MRPLAGLLLLLYLAGVAFAADPPKKPNVVVILSDDMGFSDLGCYGGEIDTPNLNELANNGVRFTQFYNTARCCPTRASLMTGLYPHQTGVGHMMEQRKDATGKPLPAYQGDLNNQCVTMAQVLRTAGYRTAMAGKWHLTRFISPDDPQHNWPLQRGFELFYGTLAGAGNYFDPARLCRQNTFITPVNDPLYRPETYYYTDAISDNAVMFLRNFQQQTPDQPFFLYVAYTAPHWPIQALPEDIDRFSDRYRDGYEPVRQARYHRLKQMGLIDSTCGLSQAPQDWESVKNKEWESRCMQVYAAMIHSMDRGIGRIVAELQAQGKLENTLIFFLHDNGGCAEGLGRDTVKSWSDPAHWAKAGPGPKGPDELQTAGRPPMKTRDGRPVLGGPHVMPGPADSFIAYGQNWANVSNTPFRQYKHYVHEGGIATPLIVHWPKGIAARGQLRHQPGHVIDIMPTCLQVAGATYPDQHDGKAIKPVEGRSLVPAFTNQPIERQALFWEHEGNTAIRIGDWKLVRKFDQKPQWELYNLATDRAELHNLAATDPDRLNTMTQAWHHWAQRTEALPWPWKQ